MPKYNSTLLAQSNDPLEIQKADLDLLKKINEVAGDQSTSTSSNEQFATSTPVAFAGVAPNVAAGATYINYTGGTGANVLIDTYAAMNVTTGIYTIPVDGTYRITVTRNVDAGTEGRDVTQLYINNSLYTEIVECWGQYDDLDGSVSLTLGKGDAIKIVKHPSVSKTGRIILNIQKIETEAILATNIENASFSVLDKPLMSGQIGTAIETAGLVGPIKIPFGEIWTQRGGLYYDVPNRRFYVPKTGRYRISMNPFKNTGSTACRVLVGINTDAPTTLNHKGDSFSNASVYDTMCINSIVSLSAGDYIVFYLYEGQLYNVSASDRFNQFAIEYISESENKIQIYNNSTFTQKGAIVNSYCEIDNATRTFSTSWADGMTWSNNSYQGNSKLLVELHIPGRVDSGNGWAGWYTELQYSINGGSFVSLGSSGYDSMNYSTTSSITNNNYHFLIPTPADPCTVQFKTRHKSYVGTLYINGSHEIVGDEFMSKLIVLEIANDNTQVQTPNYQAYSRPAFYRYFTTDNTTNQYIHFKTNQTMNSVMFAVQFQGYEYGASKPVDAMIVGYPYGPSNDVINKGTSGTHTCGAYKSSDGYVVLTFYSTNCYYLGLLLNQIGAGPQGLYPLVITASTHSSSATGVY